jgi:hypothetical protein
MNLAESRSRLAECGKLRKNKRSACRPPPTPAENLGPTEVALRRKRGCELQTRTTEVQPLVSDNIANLIILPFSALDSGLRSWYIRVQPDRANRELYPIFFTGTNARNFVYIHRLLLIT